MALNDDIAAELPFLRQQAESRMLDEWVIGTSEGWRYDPEKDEDVRTVVPLFTTKGRMTDQGGPTVTDAQAGERTVVSTWRSLHIPWNSPAVPVNALAECVAIDDSTDPTLLGAIVRLTGSAPGSQKTARRLEVVEVLT